MSRLMSAAGTAAAMFVAVFGTLHAGPSRAWEMNIRPIATPHMGAAAVPGDPLLSASPRESAEPSAAEPFAPTAEPAPPAPTEPAAPPKRSSLAELVADHSASGTGDSEHECLANAVYFESKGESLHGQLSVAEVVLNRARSGRFPASVCAVVKQRGQFSFVRGGRLPSVPRASAAWRKAVAIAHIAREDLADGPAPKALFFHATRVKPGWRGLTRVATVGNHIFYR
jgi:spore germination cell wall hydrolase CwlJ-like protein